MSVPKGKRRLSRFEAQHVYIKLRQEVTTLMLLDFGFSKEKYEKMIERYAETHKTAANVEEVVERYRKKCEAFYNWFIDRECDAIGDILRKIDSEFTEGNSIYMSDTPARLMEFCERRKHINRAISHCYILKQELNYVIRALPVDLNKYTRFAEMIDKQIALYKGVRQADNRYFKEKDRKWRKPDKHPEKNPE